MAAEEARAAIGAASLSVSRWEREAAALRTIINVGDLGPGEERYPPAEIHPLREDRRPSGSCWRVSPTSTRSTRPRSTRCRSCGCSRLGKESEVGVPILVEGEAWGEVYATTAPGQPRFRSEDVRFLETVAGQLAVAIGRAELFSRVSRLAYEDPLTGLANRRALEERLQPRRGARHRAPDAARRAALRRRRAEGHQRPGRPRRRRPRAAARGGGAGRGGGRAAGQPGWPALRRRVLRGDGGSDARGRPRARGRDLRRTWSRRTATACCCPAAPRRSGAAWMTWPS